MKQLFAQPDQLQDEYAMPLQRADMSRVPSCSIINALHDPLCDHGRLYFEKLRESGVPVRRSVYRRSIHGFIALMDVDAAALEAVTEMCSLLRFEFGMGDPKRLKESIAVVDWVARAAAAGKAMPSSGEAAVAAAVRPAKSHIGDR
eukprot:TRINITY_DN1356_c0_g1_i1.p1 TRINITY_DN1356_c0_g1~~TRINITY_DN1356_c0_g1_i1.p1  ORF type:complete len:146 (+),score=47.81 TRINITY_DN1356_c0_g1_i1:136-573(+)